jgi:membrane associated rhomboid family serine protease
VALLVGLHLGATLLAGPEPFALTRYLVLTVARSPLLLAQHGWYRLLASALFHGSWVHLALNCFGILMFSIFVEAGLGRRLTGVLLVLAVLGSSALSALATPQPAVGASTLMLALSGAAAGLALARLRRLGPGAGGLIHLAVFLGLMVISGVRHSSMDAPAHWAAGGFGFLFASLPGTLLARVPDRVLTFLAVACLLLTLGSLRLAALTLAAPPGPSEFTLGSPAAPSPHLPGGALWKAGSFSTQDGCSPLREGRSTDEALRRGELLCFTDPFFNVLFFGPAAAAEGTSVWKEAGLRTLGAKPQAFAEMALHFRTRTDGTVVGLSVFRPQEAAYLPMFLALVQFKGEYRYLEIQAP